MYMELKSGFNPNGPAMIGKVKLSKARKTIYFNGKAFSRSGGQGILGNYYDIETSEEYWISGAKKNEENRWKKNNIKTYIDQTIIDEYLNLIEKETIDLSKYELVKIIDTDIQKFNSLCNQPL